MTYDLWALLNECHPVNDLNDNKTYKRAILTLATMAPGIDEDANEETTAQAKKAKAQAKRNAAAVIAQQYERECDLKAPSPGEQRPSFGCAIAVAVEWKLQSPYYSAADNAFDVIDNPLSRDRLTGQPMQKASSAKGMLQHMTGKTHPFHALLFGSDPNEVGENACAGSVVFGDVLYDNVAVDVISPHEQKFGVADKPIYFEVVPETATGKFGFLLWARDPLKANVETELTAALVALLSSLDALLETYGMSAKRTLDFGVGDVKSVVLRPGTRFQCDDMDHSEVDNEFDEPPPKKPVKPPEHYDELVKDGNICTEEEAQQRLSGTIKKKASLKKKTIEKIHTKCEKFLREHGDMQGEVAEAYEAWRTRQRSFQSNPGNSHWKYDTLRKAIVSIERHLKTANEGIAI